MPGLGGGFKDLEGGLESEPRLDPGNEGCKGPGPGLGVILAREEVGQFVTQGHELVARGMEHDYGGVRGRPRPGEKWRRSSISWDRAGNPDLGGGGPAPGRRPGRAAAPRFPVPGRGASPAAGHRSDGIGRTRPGRRRSGRPWRSGSNVLPHLGQFIGGDGCAPPVTGLSQVALALQASLALPGDGHCALSNSLPRFGPWTTRQPLWARAIKCANARTSGRGGVKTLRLQDEHVILPLKLSNGKARTYEQRYPRPGQAQSSTTVGDRPPKTRRRRSKSANTRAG